MTVVSEFESRDRWQIEWYDKGNNAGKEILINPLIYTKDKNGSWQATSFAARQASINAALNSAGLLTETVVSVSTLISGSELLNTLPTTVYESTFDLRVGGRVSATTWIGSDGLMYKQIIKDPAQAATTVTIYEYDPTIKVEAPGTLQQ